MFGNLEEFTTEDGSELSAFLQMRKLKTRDLGVMEWPVESVAVVGECRRDR